MTSDQGRLYRSSAAIKPKTPGEVAALEWDSHVERLLGLLIDRLSQTVEAIENFWSAFPVGIRCLSGSAQTKVFELPDIATTLKELKIANFHLEKMAKKYKNIAQGVSDLNQAETFEAFYLRLRHSNIYR